MQWVRRLVLSAVSAASCLGFLLSHSCILTSKLGSQLFLRAYQVVAEASEDRVDGGTA